MAAERSPKRRAAGPGLAMLAGLVLLPASALAAVAIVGAASEDAIEPEPIEVVAAEVTTTALEQADGSTQTEQTTSLVVDPVTASPDDLSVACTIDGLALAELEASGRITPIQLAALDALRQICADEGMALPGKPAPPPVVRTVKVVKGSGGGSGSGSGGSGDPDDVVDDGGRPDDDDEDDDDEREDDTSSGSGQAAWQSAREKAAAAIAAARERNPDSEHLSEAEEKLSEARRKANEGEWWDAVEKAQEAKRKAERVGSGGDDD